MLNDSRTCREEHELFGVRKPGVPNGQRTRIPKYRVFLSKCSDSRYHLFVESLNLEELFRVEFSAGTYIHALRPDASTENGSPRACVRARGSADLSTVWRDLEPFVEFNSKATPEKRGTPARSRIPEWLSGDRGPRRVVVGEMGSRGMRPGRCAAASAEQPGQHKAIVGPVFSFQIRFSRE